VADFLEYRPPEKKRWTRDRVMNLGCAITLVLSALSVIILILAEILSGSAFVPMQR